MKVAGQITVILGLLLCGYAAFFQSVVVPGGFGERDIINIGLQQDRLLTFSFGLAVLVVGAIFQVGGEVLERLPPLVAPEHGKFQSTHLAAEAELIDRLPQNEPESVEDEMARLGVVAQGDKYVFGTYRYDRLADALAYARSHRP